MYNPNKNPGIDDHVMTPLEQKVMSIEMKEKKLLDKIARVKSEGDDVSWIESQLKDFETNRLAIIWLSKFTDEDELDEAIADVAKNGLPPEVFTSPENIHEGPVTLQ